MMRVKDCMCGEVCWVKPDTKIHEIAKIMNQNHIGCVPVCDEQNTLVGIITDRDIILRTIACDKDVKTTNASDIMTCNVCTCTQDEPITEAENKKTHTTKSIHSSFSAIVPAPGCVLKVCCVASSQYFLSSFNNKC